MRRELTAAHWARAQLGRVHDDPAGRLALLTRTYWRPIGRAPRHLPFRRAAMSFMRWQVDRGVLAPLDGNPPGSRWWRAVNDRLLVDGCEAMARSGGLGGELTLPTIGPWMSFIPRLGMAGAFLSLRRVLPDRYPLDADVHAYLARENGLGRMLDYGVIGPRLQVLY